MATARRLERARRATVTLLLTAVLLSAAPAGAATASGSFRLWLPLVTVPNSNPLHHGIATYYYATGDGACLFGPSPDDLMVAAMNAPEFDHAAVCGEYVSVTGAKGTIQVRIVDLCPECEAGTWTSACRRSR